MSSDEPVTVRLCYTVLNIPNLPDLKNNGWWSLFGKRGETKVVFSRNLWQTKGQRGISYSQQMHAAVINKGYKVIEITSKVCPMIAPKSPNPGSPPANTSSGILGLTKGLVHAKSITLQMRLHTSVPPPTVTFVIQSCSKI